MHEYSLAMNIVNIAAEHAVKANANKVLTVEVDLGKLSGIHVNSLDTAIKTAMKGTILEGANVQINHIDAKAQCYSCKNVYDTDEVESKCPSCGSTKNELVQGQEIRVKSIDIE